MPRYYFDITEGGTHTRDDFGSDCLDDGDARDQAVAVISAMVDERLPDRDDHEVVAAVRNEAGAVVYEASLALNGRWWPGRG